MPRPKECEYSEFSQMSADQRRAAFQTCTLDQQLDLHLWTLMSTRPSSYRLIGPLAARGSDLIPVILRRIEHPANGGDEAMVAELLHVLRDMHEQKHYDVLADKDLMARLKRGVGRLKDYVARRHAEIELGGFTHGDAWVSEELGKFANELAQKPVE